MKGSKFILSAVIFGLGSLSGVFAGGFLSPPPAAMAAESMMMDTVCIQGCLTDLHGCLTDGRDTFDGCVTQANCGPLATQMHDLCAADNMSTACTDARAAYRQCMQPCRMQMRGDMRTCRNDSLTRLHDACGLSDLPLTCR